MFLLNSDKCPDIFCKNTNEYVRLALLDLIDDFALVSAQSAKPSFANTMTEHCIVVEQNCLSPEEAINDESFSIKIEGERMYINAPGYLGSMWAIYTVSEKMLGINPCYPFCDLEPEKHETLNVSDCYIKDRPSGFGFRGIFINDEDLLSAWKAPGGMRHIDYPFYTFVIPESVADMIVRTALRLKLNLVIPASFLDIDNPCERLVAKCVSRRGIFLSQHHVEPVGVSAYTFENYCRKHAKSGTFSYMENPQLLEEVWEYYAEKWAEFENVVWQTGLRGKGDRPVWQNDVPTEEELGNYGKFISGAVKKQREIIDRVTNSKAKHFTSTLWMEGSELMQKGLLDIPEDNIVVFSDNGTNQMFGKDFHGITRSIKQKRGIYYHVQYWGDGPHLAPLTGVDKLYYNIKLAYDKGDTSYIILNTSNIREFTYELAAYAKMTWNTQSFSTEGYGNEYAACFGDKAAQVKEAVREYYESIGEADASYLVSDGFRWFNFNPDENSGKIKNFTLKDGYIASLGRNLADNFKKEPEYVKKHEMFYGILQNSAKSYAKAFEKFESISDTLTERQKKHFTAKWLCHAYTMSRITEWYLLLFQAKKAYDRREQSDNVTELLERACQCLEELLEYRKRAEYGIFENWYRGEIKINIKNCLACTLRLLGRT